MAKCSEKDFLVDKLAQSIDNLSYQARRWRAIQESIKSGEEESDLTEREALILEIIRDRSYSVTEIGRFLPGVAVSTISTEITKLWSEKGLLTKNLDPKNQRMRIVELTKKGKNVLKNLRQARLERLKHFIEAMELEGDEAVTITKVFSRAAGRLEKEISDLETKLREGSIEMPPLPEERR